MRLEPFAEDQVREALVTAGVPEDVAAAVGRRAGGRPRAVNQLLRAWHGGEQPTRVIAGLRGGGVPRLRARWKLIDTDSRRLVRLLVDAGGKLPLAELQVESGLSRLLLKSKLRELERKHGWLRVESDRVVLTEPSLGTVLEQEPAD